MICLDIQDYCASCCDFEPDVTRPVKTSVTTFSNEDTVIQSDTVVRCTHAKRCECIKRYLSQQFKQCDSKKE